MINIQYAGKKPAFIDHLFGTGLTWTPGEAHEVDETVAVRMLRFPTFKAIAVTEETHDGQQPVPTRKPRTRKPKENDVIDLVEEDRGQPLVNLETMDEAGLAEYAHRHFGVVLEGEKAELIEAIRLKMGQRTV